MPLKRGMKYCVLRYSSKKPLRKLLYIMFILNKKNIILYYILLNEQFIKDIKNYKLKSF